MHKILVLQGPNLNLLGQREPAVYGYDTLDDIHRRLSHKAESAQIAIDFMQSNNEAALIERIHQALQEKISLIIFNPAALTHTSIALRDAILAVAIPMIEVHVSNIHKREPFRHTSYFADLAIGTIGGFGAAGYEAAFDLAVQWLAKHAHTQG